MTELMYRFIIEYANHWVSKRYESGIW